jgi:hypothetical protein
VLGPDDLREERLVSFPRAVDPALYDRMLALLGRAGYSFSVVGEAGSKDPRDLLLAVAGGMGVALEPLSLKEVSEAGGIVVRRPLDPTVTMPDTVIAWPTQPQRHLRTALPTSANSHATSAAPQPQPDPSVRSWCMPARAAIGSRTAVPDPDLLPLTARQRSALLPDGVRNRDAPEIVQQRRNLQLRHRLAVEPEALAGRPRHLPWLNGRG